MEKVEIGGEGSTEGEAQGKKESHRTARLLLSASPSLPLL
jgi:hypothetical protein